MRDMNIFSRSVEDATGVSRATKATGAGEDGRSVEGEDPAETG